MLLHLCWQGKLARAQLWYPVHIYGYTKIWTPVKHLGPRLAVGWVTVQGLDVDVVAKNNVKSQKRQKATTTKTEYMHISSRCIHIYPGPAGTGRGGGWHCLSVGLQPGWVLAGGPCRLGSGGRPHANQLSHQAGQAGEPAQGDRHRGPGLWRAECRGGATHQAEGGDSPAHHPSGRGISTGYMLLSVYCKTGFQTPCLLILGFDETCS